MIGEPAASGVTSGSTSENKLLLTVEEAAQRLAVGRTVMYRLVSSGAVESVHLGRLRRVPRERLDEFISTLRRHQSSDDDPAQDGTA